MKWSYLLYCVVLGLLLVSLQFFHYRFVLLRHATEWYVGLIALIFTILGIWAGIRWTRKPAPVFNSAPGQELSAPPDLPQFGITPREYEVLLLLAQGYSNQEIADRLFVSLNTIKTHLANLFSKLDVQRRTQAIEKARLLGLLPPPKG